MKNAEAIRAFLALGQETRLAVFRCIVEKGDAGIRPAQLAELLSVPAATLSFHLKELLQSNLVTMERQSRHLVYRPRVDVVEQLMGFLLFNCCGGKSCSTTLPKKVITK